MSLIKVLMT